MARKAAENEELEHIGVVSYSSSEQYFEMLYDNGRASLAVRDKYGKVTVVDRMVVNIGSAKVVIEPFPVSPHSLIAQRAVLLPSKPLSYKDQVTLLELIRQFIHRFVELNPIDEQIAAHYVLLTWRYDSFGALPYLRFHGDWGVGKSRALQTVGALCYRPMFVAGALGPAPIFRMINRYHGTFILDEADNISDDVITILNCGYKEGTPVIRCDKEAGYEPTSYVVYGPKVIGTRRRFKDVALESRCLTIQMQARTRTDIPVTLSSFFWWKAKMLRNMLLTYRFNHLDIDKLVLQGSEDLEPRLQEICAPFIAVIGANPPLLAEIKSRMRELQGQLRQDGAVSVEGHVVVAASEVINEGSSPTMKAIADRASNAVGYPLSSQRVGKIIRNLGLNISRPKGHVALRQDENNLAKLKRLKERYDIK